MGKLLLAALAALLVPNDAGRMTNPTITISPIPPVAGQKMEITYTGTPGTKLSLDWDPASEPSSVTVDANGKASVVVPVGATSVIVDDPTGAAKAVSSMIQS
jgi:hypothetical protein